MIGELKSSRKLLGTDEPLQNGVGHALAAPPGEWKRVHQAVSYTHLLSRETKTEIARGPGLLDLPRCVKLNNYWCIKRARWAGEIAADAEGHVAFASAIDGAIAAAILLRRYYIDYNRRSACLLYTSRCV